MLARCAMHETHLLLCTLSELTPARCTKHRQVATRAQISTSPRWAKAEGAGMGAGGVVGVRSDEKVKCPGCL